MPASAESEPQRPWRLPLAAAGCALALLAPLGLLGADEASVDLRYHLCLGAITLGAVTALAAAWRGGHRG